MTKSVLERDMDPRSVLRFGGDDRGPYSASFIRLSSKSRTRGQEAGRTGATCSP